MAPTWSSGSTSRLWPLTTFLAPFNCWTPQPARTSTSHFWRVEGGAVVVGERAAGGCRVRGGGTGVEHRTDGQVGRLLDARVQQVAQGGGLGALPGRGDLGVGGLIETHLWLCHGVHAGKDRVDVGRGGDSVDGERRGCCGIVGADGELGEGGVEAPGVEDAIS